MKILQNIMDKIPERKKKSTKMSDAIKDNIFNIKKRFPDEQVYITANGNVLSQ